MDDDERLHFDVKFVVRRIVSGRAIAAGWTTKPPAA